MAKDNFLSKIIRKVDPTSADILAGDAGRKITKRVSKYQKKKVRLATSKAYKAGKRAGFKRGKKAGYQSASLQNLQRVVYSRRRF